jgi:hypothetical protein
MFTILGFFVGVEGGEADRLLLTGEEDFDLWDPWLANMASIPPFRLDTGSMNVGDSLPTLPTSGDTG